MASNFDTIVAPISGHPPAAIAVLRVSGPSAWQVAQAVFRPWPASPHPKLALYGRFVNGDDGYALPFARTHSFTGEQSVEFSIHGSSASINSLMTSCCQFGARPAQPGEFTMRAFLNGRIDLVQAEAVRETVESETEAQLLASHRNRLGELSSYLERIASSIQAMVSAIEASVDFSEEIGEFDATAAITALAPIRREMQDLIDRSKVHRLIHQGLKVAIVGPPNAGKSSLLNALLQSSRAIVSNVPGTTRDTIEERCDFNGFPVVLVDTAGLRETPDTVEIEGVRRAREAADLADLVWYVYDSSLGLTETERASIHSFRKQTWLLGNKSDLVESTVQTTDQITEGMPISAKTGKGLDILVQRVVKAFEEVPLAPLVNDRQAHHLIQAARAIDDLLSHLGGETPPDLLSVLCREALDELGQITGKSYSEELLDRIFRDFCLGK